MTFFYYLIFCTCVFAADNVLDFENESLSIARFSAPAFPDSSPDYYTVILDIPESNFHIKWKSNHYSQIAWTDGKRLSTNAPIEFFHNEQSHIYDRPGCWHTFSMPHFPLFVWSADRRMHNPISQKTIITPGVHITPDGIYFQSDHPMDVGSVLDQIPINILEDFSSILRNDLNSEDFCDAYPMHKDLIQGIIVKGQRLPFTPKPFVKPTPKTLVKLADFLIPENDGSEKESTP